MIGGWIRDTTRHVANLGAHGPRAPTRLDDRDGDRRGRLVPVDWPPRRARSDVHDLLRIRRRTANFGGEGEARLRDTDRHPQATRGIGGPAGEE